MCAGRDVMVEADPTTALLTPAAVGGKPTPSAAVALADAQASFTPDGIPNR